MCSLELEITGGNGEFLFPSLPKRGRLLAQNPSRREGPSWDLPPQGCPEYPLTQGPCTAAFLPFYFVFSDDNSRLGPFLHSLCHIPRAWQGFCGQAELAGTELAVPLQPSLRRGGRSWDTEPRARPHKHQTNTINRPSAGKAKKEAALGCDCHGRSLQDAPGS